MSENIKRLVSRRAYKKGQITQDLKALEALDEAQLNCHLLDQYIKTIEDSLSVIEGYDMEICTDMSDSEIEEVVASSRVYHMDINLKLSRYKALREGLVAKKSPDPSGTVTPGKIVKLPLPPIQIQTFENNSENPFSYFTFKKSFKNAIAGMPNLTGAQKLIYLKGYLTGEALNLIENIPVEDGKFDEAIDLLDQNFLDKDLIIDKTLSSILSAPEVSQVKEVESFIRLIINKVHDLKGVGVDLTRKNTSGLLLLSKIINLKLPRQFLIELSRVTNTNYPTFNLLVERYQDILVRLRLGFNDQGVKPKAKGDHTSSNSKGDHKSKPSTESKTKDNANVDKGKANAEQNKKQALKCKFCPSTEHSSSKCHSYNTLETRKARASSLGMCSRCLNQKHHTSECPGNKAALPYKCFVCGKSEHHGALCPQSKDFGKSDKKIFNFHNGSDIIVPVISLPVGRGKNNARCHFLLDTGAQFSIINKEFVENKVGACLSPPMSKMVSSFGMPSAIREGFNYTADLTLPCGNKIFCIFFAMEGFSLPIKVHKLPTVIQSMNDHDYVVSPDFPRVRGEDIQIFGIIGNDILQCFNQFNLKKVSLFGKQSCRVIKVDNGYLPFGSGVNYMPPNREREYFDSILKSSDEIVLSEVEGDICKTQNLAKIQKVTAHASSKIVQDDDEVYTGRTQIFYNSAMLTETANKGMEKFQKESIRKLNKSFDYAPPKKLGREKLIVNFAINPVGYQFDPLQVIFLDPSVEYGLDNFYNLESLGIKEEDSLAFENDQVEKFKESIIYRDGHYHVKLPWKDDLIKQVPSNLKISLAVAERVYDKLENKGIVDKYEEVFDQQEALGIIEEVKERVPGLIFIPHRPVIKNDDLTTTKIRPVFNCSLKVGKSPSLNEAAFPGIDLMNNLLSLLLYFRTNNCAVLADIMKAFLQIKLSAEDDRNRFCFFRKIDGRYVPYRYNTIIFGFVSSPFVLNYIVQHHLAVNAHLEVASLLRNKFYMDNLIYTSNKVDELPQTVNQVNKLMIAGGLPLREWTSNNTSVLSSLQKEEICNAEEVKVLGYLYNRVEDTLRLKNASLDCSASTKRQILSSLASVFDPLGIFAPVLLQGKLMIRQMCKKMIDWDQKLDSELLARWVRLCKTFDEVSVASFARRSLNSDIPVKLYVFADASKEAYGCSIYAVQEQNCSLLFAKVKVSPIKERTLPTLELLAAQLSLKCLKTIFEDGFLSEALLKSIVLFVDSQVVLSWILGNKAPRKNVFVGNRLKEISELLEILKCKYGQVSLSYIPSLHNQADFLTKPCSSKVFLERFSWWTCGPQWIFSPPQEWPKGQLGCIPCAVKGELVSTVLGYAKATPLVDICKYSSYSKLVGVVTKVFTAIFRFKKSSADPVEAANCYLVSLMQEEAFPLELGYLRDPKSTVDTPNLVSQLNLFLDKHGIIRSKGRIDKNIDLKYHVVNPVLMPKHHHLTKLVIYFAHCKTMHMGLQATLNFIRMHGFWVLKARQAVLNTLKDCIACKRYNARPVNYPSPSSLPASRVNLSVPFAHTGVDYTGHLWVTNQAGEKVKVYILIFTCFNTRAVHLEAVSTMSTAEFILAFVRFVNRYGTPSVVYSDNAKSFIQAGNIIEQLLTSSEFEEKFRIASISHKTIPIYAAWYGATWERLIKTVKHCLFKVLGRSTPTLPEFVTFLSDIQKILNNRPLTYRSCENEVDIITPNHFLVGRPIPSIILGDEQVPEWEYDEEGDYSSHLARVLNLRDLLYEEFKERWLSEYLVNLREKDRASFRNPKTWEKGEIALLKLPSKTKPYWPLVHIVDTYPDLDQVIRTVEVAKPDGNRVKVNVKHLIPLELYCELNTPNNDVEDSDDPFDDLEPLEESFSDVDERSEPVGSIDEAVASSIRPSRRTAQASRAQTKTLASQGLL